MSAARLGWLDLGVVETTPGAATGPFTPPAGFEGDEREFVLLMRQRYDSLEYGQQMRVMVKQQIRCKDYELRFTGPYAEKAKALVNYLVRKSLAARS